MDKVSIVIPVYNAEKYLEECIESAINQTYQNIEIIAVNDGSTDDSLKILERYSDKIKIISKENGGTASALNAGISEATGEWIKWLSDDDVLHPNAIHELISVAQKISNKKNTVFYSHLEEIDSEGNFIKKIAGPDYSHLNNFDRNAALLGQDFPNINTSLIHKDMFEKYGLWDEKVDFAVDYELLLRLGLQYKCNFHLIPKILLKYRRHEKQSSSVTLDVHSKEVDNINKKILCRLDPIDQQKYKIELKNYQKNWSVDRKMKHAMYNFISKLLSPEYANKSAKLYQKYKQRSRK